MSQSKAEVLLQLRDRMTPGLRKATQSVKDHQATFRKASLMMAGAAAVLGGALFASARAGREQERALRSATVNVEGSGTKWADVSDEIIEKSRELADNTNFNFAEVMGVYGTLVGMTGDWKKSLELLEPTLDLQTEKGNDLAGAARNVVRFTRDAAGELKEVYFPVVSDTATETDRLAMLTEQFGDNARGNVDPVSRLTSGMTDLLAAMGVGKVVDTLANALFRFASILRDNLPEGVLQGIGIAITVAFGALTIGAAVAGILALGGALTGLVPIMVGGTALFSIFGLTVGIALGPLALIVAALAAVGVAAFLLWKNWDTVWGFITTAFEKVSSAISGAFQSKWGWLLPGGPLIKAVLFVRDNWGVIWGTIQTGFDKVSGFLSSVFRSKWAWLLPTGPFIKAILFLRDNWAEIWGGIKTTVATVWADIKKTVLGAWDTITALFTGDFGGVLSGLGRMWDGIKGIFKAGVNAIIGTLNVLIRAMNTIQVKIPSWVPGLGGKGFGINLPEIPKMAHGGIVRRPTLALVGESGPEAIVPLSRGGGAGVGGSVVVNVAFPENGLIFLDNANSQRRLAQIITRLVRAELRGQRELVSNA